MIRYSTHTDFNIFYRTGPWHALTKGSSFKITSISIIRSAYAFFEITPSINFSSGFNALSQVKFIRA